MPDSVDIAPPSAASEPLRRFLQVARGAGLRISASEGIDAARALDVIGYADRAALKDTLGLVLAKTPDEKALYHDAFELYFRHEALTGKAHDEQDSDDAADGPPLSEGNALSELLTADFSRYKSRNGSG